MLPQPSTMWLWRRRVVTGGTLLGVGCILTKPPIPPVREWDCFTKGHQMDHSGPQSPLKKNWGVMKTTFLSTKTLCSPGGRPSPPPTPCPSTTHPDIRSLRKRIHLQFCDTSGTANKRRRPTHEAKCWVLFVYLWWAPEVFVCLASPALAQHERNSALVTLTSFAAGWRAELFKSSSAVIIGSLGSFIQQVASVESVMCPQVQLEFELVMFAQWPLQYSAGRMHAYLIIYWLIYCFVAVINIECAVKCWRMWKGWVSKADQDQAMLCSWKSVPFSWFGGNP